MAHPRKRETLPPTSVLDFRHFLNLDQRPRTAQGFSNQLSLFLHLCGKPKVWLPLLSQSTQEVSYIFVPTRYRMLTTCRGRQDSLTPLMNDSQLGRPNHFLWKRLKNLPGWSIRVQHELPCPKRICHATVCFTSRPNELSSLSNNSCYNYLL